MRRVSRADVARHRNELGEYVVRAYDQDGRRFPQADYHTDDLRDAVATAEAMVREAGE